MHIARFLKWGSTTLTGHLVLFQLIFSVPMYLLALYVNYLQGSLTLLWGFYTAFACAVIGSVFAVVFWFTISSGLIKKRERRD
jgi:hypothetical protein